MVRRCHAFVVRNYIQLEKTASLSALRIPGAGFKNDRWGRHECRGRLIQFVFDGMSRPRNDQTSCDPFYNFVKVLYNFVKVPYNFVQLGKSIIQLDTT